MSKLNIWITFIIFILYFERNCVHGCRCSPFQYHPQELICNADYVFVGKVLSEVKIPGQLPDPNNNFAIFRYTFRLIFPIKGTFGNVGSNVIVETPGNGGLCGRRLTVGETLLLSGRENNGIKRILLCDLILNINTNISFEQMGYFFNSGSYSYVGNCKKKNGRSVNGCKMPKNKKLRSCYYKKALCLQKSRNKWSWVNVDC